MVRTDKNGVEYVDDVKFSAIKSQADNCLCDGCKRSGKVIKITYPNTLYYDGKNLTTKYRHIWLCPDCLRKLQRAIETAKKEGEINDQ